ncbi:MAG: BON domain-containing protein [Acidobacteriaceae bacterium]
MKSSGYRSVIRRWLHYWMVRELVVCVVLPSVLLIGAEVVAQKTSASPTPTQSRQLSDDQVANEIDDKLMASNALRPLDLGVWVHDGTATLSGTVPNAQVRQQADALVRAVSGVQRVDDQLTIGTFTATAPGFSGKHSTAPAAAGNSAASGPATYGAAPVQQGAQDSAPPRAYQAQSMPLLTVPAQTPLYVMMMQTVDSHHTQPGTGFRGIVVRNIEVAKDVIAVPRGAYVEGTIIDARPAGHLKGRPQLALQLSNVNIGRASYVLSSYVWAHEGPGKGGETASAVAGSAGIGAITGAIVGGGPVALLGAAIGGLGGAGLSALSSGPHLVVPAESVITFHLNAPLTVREPTASEVRIIAANLPSQGYRRRRRNPPPIPGAPPGGYPY